MSCALVTLLHPKSANIHEYSNVKESCPETKYSTHRRQIHLFFFSFAKGYAKEKKNKWI
jgi:hypothetical protein